MKRTFVFLVTLTLVTSIFLTPQPAGAWFCDTTTVQGNCVKFVRSRMTLPAIDLTTYSAKKSIINHRFPTVGSAAIMPSSGTNAPYGHIAIVKSVAIRTSDGGLQLTIEESNWGDCAIATRTVTPESRSIDGYYDPRYTSGQSHPKLDFISPSSGTAGVKFDITASGTGFEAASAQGIILGGWCETFGKCTIPNNVMPTRTSTTLKMPVTLGNPGKYMLYIFNSASGKTSNGKPITIN